MSANFTELRGKAEIKPAISCRPPPNSPASQAGDYIAPQMMISAYASHLQQTLGVIIGLPQQYSPAGRCLTHTATFAQWIPSDSRSTLPYSTETSGTQHHLAATGVHDQARSLDPCSSTSSDTAAESSDTSTDEYNTEDEEDENNSYPVDDSDYLPAASPQLLQHQLAAVATVTPAAGCAVAHQQKPAVELLAQPQTPPSSPACHTATPSHQQQQVGLQLLQFHPDLQQSGTAGLGNTCQFDEYLGTGRGAVLGPQGTSSISSQLQVLSAEPGTPIGSVSLRVGSMTATPPPSPAWFARGYLSEVDVSLPQHYSFE